MAITKENIIPLAGMFQAGYLVQDIAQNGRYDREAFETCLNSILETNPESVESVYGNDVTKLKLGFTLLENMFSKDNKQRDMEIARYILGIIHLEKKLRKNKEIFDKLGDGIDRARAQVEAFGSVTHENVIASLAEVYSETISKIHPQIMVSGDSQFLTDSNYANKIRACLLALMRSTVLWLQKGGNRWHLILQRGKIIQIAQQVKPIS